MLSNISRIKKLILIGNENYSKDNMKINAELSRVSNKIKPLKSSQEKNPLSNDNEVKETTHFILHQCKENKKRGKHFHIQKEIGHWPERL